MREEDRGWTLNDRNRLTMDGVEEFCPDQIINAMFRVANTIPIPAGCFVCA